MIHCSFTAGAFQEQDPESSHERKTCRNNYRQIHLQAKVATEPWQETKLTSSSKICNIPRSTADPIDSRSRNKADVSVELVLLLMRNVYV